MLHRNVLSQFCVLLIWLFCAADAAATPKKIPAPVGRASSREALQGQCGTFVKECYKTCFGLAKLQVRYTCTLKDGTYQARCLCGSTDQTGAVLTKAGIPNVKTTTLATLQTQDVLVTATSTSVSTSATTATLDVSVCSSTTFLSTVLVTSTYTAAPTTVTTTVTSTTTANVQAPNSVPGVVVTPGDSGTRKRGATSFCNDIAVACNIGCAALFSKPTANVCQAVPFTSTYTLACVCKNNVNVMQKVLQGYNLLRSLKSRCTQISATTVPATATSTILSASTIVVTRTTVVVPTTAVTVLTNTVTRTNTFPCPTTLTTSLPVTEVVTPTATATETTVLTTVVAAAPTLYHVAFSAAGAQPTFVSQSYIFGFAATSTVDKEEAQAFAIAERPVGSGMFDIIGAGPGDFAGQYLSAQLSYQQNKNDGSLYYFINFIGTSDNAKSNLWKLNFRTLGLVPTWILDNQPGAQRTELQGMYDPANEVLDATNDLAFSEQTFGNGFFGVTFFLVPA